MYKKILSVVTGLMLCFTAAYAGKGAPDFGAYEWTLVNEEARWAPRAGLQVVGLKNRIYLMGGRTPRPPSFPPVPGDSDIRNQVTDRVPKSRLQ